MDTVARLTTLDENYLPQLQVLLFSIYLNNPGENCSLYLIHSGIREESLAASNRSAGTTHILFIQ
ncbi:MAG: hypothetical protein V8T45_07245 [Oscillospiraceae bacterium]